MENRTLTLALASAGLLVAGAAWADADINFSGFGTLAATHSNNRLADFSGSILQPNGAGRSSPWMFGVDTKAGVQASAKIGKDLSATLQVVSDHRGDNTYAPRFEWANLKYQVTQNTYVRAGRVVAPVFMVSDYRNVGYSQTPLRMPFDVYGLNPITHIDGGEFGTRFELAGGTLSLQLSGGRQKESKPMPVPGASAIIQPKGSAKSGNLSYEYGSSNFRLGVTKSRVDAQSEYLDQVDSMFAPLAALGGASVGALLGHPENTIASRGNIEVTLFDIGYAYDSGNWLAQTEYVASKSSSNMFVSLDSWYVLAGYRLGKFTPYASYSDVRSRVSSGVTSQPRAVVPAGLPPAFASPLQSAAWGINSTDASLSMAQQQHTISLGVRYDFYKNLALKAQYDQIRKPGSPAAPNKGLFTIPAALVGGTSLYPEFATTDNTVNLVTVALDFVF